MRRRGEGRRGTARFAIVAIAALCATAVPAGAVPVRGLGRVAARIASGEGLRIVAFGSSSTQGIGASVPAAAYPARLQAVLRTALPRLGGRVEVANRGVGGEDVDDMLARLDRDVIAQRPDLVIWQTGSNDPMRGVPIDRFESSTRGAVARMRRAGIDVVLMEPQWCPRLDATPGSAAFRDAVRAIGHDMGVPVIRRFDLMRDWAARRRLAPDEMLAGDGLHMSDRGYALLARTAAAEILGRAGALDGPEGEAAAAAVED